MENLESMNGQSNQVVQAETVNEPVKNESQSINLDDYLPKTRVNELIHQRTKEVSQKAYEKARAELQQQQQGIGGMQGIDEDKIRQLMQQEFDRRQEAFKREHEERTYKETINNIANDFMGKITAAKDTYPDLIKRQEEIAELATLVPYINESAEAAGITQHLLDNEGAFANLMLLANQSPTFLRRAIKKIEASIQENQAALNRDYPSIPSKDPQPSITLDSGSNSIEALKRQSWLRG